jgi:undecaprenyl diphosphate synthase
VSLWALSRENILERSPAELEAIFYILKKSLPSLVEKMISSSISLQVVGDLWLLPPDVRQILLEAIDRTSAGQKLTCILAIGYSGQDEILRAIRRMAHEGIDMRILESPEFLQYRSDCPYWWGSATLGVFSLSVGVFGVLFYRGTLA